MDFAVSGTLPIYQRDVSNILRENDNSFAPTAAGPNIVSDPNIVSAVNRDIAILQDGENLRVSNYWKNRNLQMFPVLRVLPYWQSFLQIVGHFKIQIYNASLW